MVRLGNFGSHDGYLIYDDKTGDLVGSSYFQGDIQQQEETNLWAINLGLLASNETATVAAFKFGSSWLDKNVTGVKEV
ncbi:hypothetical protein JTE90_026766 [Oedothorax gibbosus]|uniref:Uncharacterized protein n=1 Tax=Oedothorax gibbosus TaxID=931172 RepID=A0AAV6UW49_9ARAC|nr:hypothetical protein JTE90_026766 [Oedothorax gibbosus]